MISDELRSKLINFRKKRTVSALDSIEVEPR